MQKSQLCRFISFVFLISLPLTSCSDFKEREPEFEHSDSSLEKENTFTRLEEAPLPDPEPLPEPPTFHKPGTGVKREIATIQEGRFVAPHIPALRKTSDGRVGVGIKTEYIKSQPGVRFFLTRPELLQKPFGVSEPDHLDQVVVLGHHLKFSDIIQNAPDEPESYRHITVCDPSQEWLPDFPNHDSTLEKHYACNDAGERSDEGPYDCYDFTLVVTAEMIVKTTWRIVGINVKVQVENPKTVDARIRAVQAEPETWGPPLNVKDLLEPMITNDGRLFVARIGHGELSWFDWNKNNLEKTKHPEIVYSVIYDLEHHDPCDVTKWNEFIPVSHAHVDIKRGMPERYGFAKFPLRDPEGNLIKDGAPLKGTYPWIDRAGANLFFETVNSTLFYDNPETDTVEARYENRCIDLELGDPYCLDLPPKKQREMVEHANEQTRGIAFAGLWSHGKIVLLDSLINNTDYGLRDSDEYHRLVRLYRGEHGEVRVGAGRSNPPPNHSKNSHRHIGNLNFIDSLENMFNYVPELQPLTLRDVVWIMNTGRGSAEIAFDDYVSPNAIIISEMTGSLKWMDDDGSTSIMEYADGFDKKGLFLNADGYGFGKEVRVQNAPTSTTWKLPPSGIVRGARLEPIALGGIEGKGLWLNGNAEIKYEMKDLNNDKIDDTPLYLSIFIDPRFDDSQTSRVLFELPSKMTISLIGHNSLRFSHGDQEQTIDLARPLENSAWNHIAILRRPISGSKVDVDIFVDGFRSKTISLDSESMSFKGDTLIVGQSSTQLSHGFRGWIDEVKLIAEDPGLEVACNHARGTLVALMSSDHPWYERHAPPAFDPAAHAELADKSNDISARFACFHRYDQPYSAYLGHDDQKEKLYSIRETLLTGGHKLRFDEPRPDFSTNTFCTSCHYEDPVYSKIGGLGLEALSANPSELMQDDRRQPMQPPRAIYGVIPRELIFSSLPTETTIGGSYLDQWVYGTGE